MSKQLGKLVAEYLEHYCAGKSAELLKNTKSRLKPLVEHFGEKCVASTISREGLEGFQKAMASRQTKNRGGQLVSGALSVFTIDSRMRSYRALFNWAVRSGRLKTNPMAGLRKVKLPRKAPAAIEQSMVDALLRGVERSGMVDREPWLIARDVAIIFTLRDTGARVGGLASATLQELNLREQRLYVVEKGQKGREVYLSEPTIEKLRLYLELREKFWRGTEGGALFVSRYGQSLLPNAITQMLKRAARLAGVEGKCNPHSFRHAFARDLLKAGADLSRVSQMMGHSDVQVTHSYYARWTDAELKMAHRQFGPVRRMMDDGGQVDA